MNTKALFLPRSCLVLKSLLVAMGAAALLGACGSRLPALYDTQRNLPEEIRVPPGNTAVLEAEGRGNLTYECQAIKRAPYEYQWLLRSSIQLKDGSGRLITYYPGPRVRWVHSDGSQVQAQELIEVAGDPKNLPLQRAKAEPSPTTGALQNISYVQNLRTQGGIVTNRPCTAAVLGMRMTVPYEANYVFWRPSS